MEIRDIGETDISPIVQVLNGGDLATFPLGSSDVLWKNYVHNPNHHTIVAEDGNSIVGTASLIVERKFRHGGSAVGHIEDVAVLHSHQHKGIGKSLIKCLLGHSRREGCYKVVLSCSSKNIPFYIKCGFRVDQHCMRIEPGTC